MTLKEFAYNKNSLLCRTQEEADTLLDALDAVGVRWVNGSSLSEHREKVEDTMIYFSGDPRGGISWLDADDVDFLLTHGFNIVDWSDIEEFEGGGVDNIDCAGLVGLLEGGMT